MDLVLREFSIVCVSIYPGRPPKSFLHTFDIGTVELRLVGHCRDSSTILFIIFPEATMGRPIAVSVDSESMGFLLSPIALIKVAISVNQTSVTIDRVMSKVALI